LDKKVEDYFNDRRWETAKKLNEQGRFGDLNDLVNKIIDSHLIQSSTIISYLEKKEKLK